ncbi:Phosphatidylserine synthase [Acropora cervicornis]|uniref:Phosphatidylserine synthase n=1 Tax=Acropora cervicornis TaxID=6130 RepID=A0AAD9PTM6_ACRCE|nr:Phosphatidylserine synthase [Acropora cervicornis]
MADDRGLRRRKRTFSTTSTISTDDYQDASEQIVEDITLEYFYKPRSITALGCLFIYLVYSAFTRNPDATLEENIWSPFIRPHPAIWRLIFGASVLYLLFLAFALFQTREDFRKILFFFDPKLKLAGPDTKEYAVNCSQVTMARLWSHCDIFAFAHFFGWALKALLIRHAGLLWTASITWEVTEVFFTHLLPNFEECWWDALLLDFLICNGLGIHFGLDIHTTTGKLRRAVLQFTPASWTHVRWMDPKCSYMRFFAICQLVVISQVVELNTFFLKHILWVPTSHWLNFYRLGIISLIVAPSLRAITCLEMLICVKYGLDMFKNTEIVSIVLWLLFQMAISMLVLYFMVMTKSMEGNVLKNNLVEKLKMFKKYGVRKPTFLEEIPAEDPSTITMNYVKTNGHHIFQDRSDGHKPGTANGSYDVAVVKNVSSQDGEEKSVEPISALTNDHKVAKRKSRRSEVGRISQSGNFEMTTRLRARKSQAAL